MNRLNLSLLLYTVVLLEGYVVLSTELLTIRQSLPYVGSGTDTISIIIAAVLLPLSFGYYAGSKFRPGLHNGRYKTVRKRLIRNMVFASLILLPGLSYLTLQKMFKYVVLNFEYDRLVLTSVYSVIFLVIPIYLLGQTIPLISHYFAKKSLARMTGRILFFSTLGSFLGAVFTTVVLMPSVGVNNAVSLIFILLAVLTIILSRRKNSLAVMAAVSIALAGIALNSNNVLAYYKVIQANAYNTIAVYEHDNERHLYLNNNPSSKYSSDGRKYLYIEFLEKLAIAPLMNADPPRDILVIGTGAFTFGSEDENNHYDYVDIDKNLKNVAEEYVLKKKLTKNKTFHPLPARAYLTKTDKKYDVILLDTYYGWMSMPEHLLTREFFMQVKAHLKDKGVVLANIVSSPNFNNAFSRNFDNTFRSVFPNFSRHANKGAYKLWDEDPGTIVNATYIYKHYEDADEGRIYTDDKNRAFLDKPTAK